jgi:hypothetical protein
VENTGRLAADRTPVFNPPVYFKQEADMLKCGALATPVGVDFDGDGVPDFLGGAEDGRFYYLRNDRGARK